MKAIPPHDETLSTLRAIARAGFGYRPTKALAQSSGWRLVDDELDLGYVAFEVPFGKDELRRIAVQVSESSRPPRAFVPLFYIDDEECEGNREPFDHAYQALADELGRQLGPASSSGKYECSHRENWPYGYCGWALGDATLVLVQDEFDIQFGMDVTLWVLPEGAEVTGEMSLG